MRTVSLRLVGTLLVRVTSVVLALMLCGSVARAQSCPEGNLLLGHKPQTQRGVSSSERLTDGWATLDGMDWLHADAARFDDAASEVTWDIGQETDLRGLEVQADANDIYVVSSSMNARDWSTVWESSAHAGSGLTTRQWVGQAVRARYLRLQARGGDGAYSASELRAFCKDAAPFYPPLLVHQNLPISLTAVKTLSAYSGKIATLLAGVLAVFLGMARLKKRRSQQIVALTLIALAAVAWTYFFAFNDGSALHVSDSFHYFMGPKYFRQTGYFDLYRCVAQAERELGHGEEYKYALVRDLDDNRIWRGDWLTGESGRCRAEFAPIRWQEFKNDVAQFREVMKGQIPLPRVLLDHGFNATPFHASFLRIFALRSFPTRSTLLALAQLDSLALILAAGAMWWGFGPAAAALFALLIGTGANWGYQLVGGTIGRHIWLAWAALGVSAAGRKRTGLATFALTMAGLHRLFPFVLLGGYVTWLAWDAYKVKRLTADTITAMKVICFTMVAALSVVSVSIGPSSIAAFSHVVARHAATPGANRLGFPLLLSVGPGRFDLELEDRRLTDPTEVWVLHVKTVTNAHWPVHLLAIILGLGLVLWVAHRGTAWETILATAPLLFALQDMTSYDYIWLTLLVPLAMVKSRWRVWLIAYVLATVIVTLIVPSVEHQHFILNWALCLVLVRLGVELWQRPGLGHLSSDAIQR